ncbi:sulfurtransferase-like selenium metabolism protein YedF [Pleomorphochaeta sp. DL1XJH-081]|uniref:sulfurtransferase-like selenium metabolism protein YedF n=1 Tax=Pleomorphochaeta sp. DL1XJH-081 TaxID=3409690 RepID=UPI003BB5DE4F
MSNTIDATGKACPIPFMLAKEQIDAKQQSFIVQVDNRAAVENLKRLAASQGFSTSVETQDGIYQVQFDRESKQQKGAPQAKWNPDAIGATVSTTKDKSSYLIFLGKDTMGEGDLTLGRNLVRMFLYTLEKGENLPTTIVLMNSGVKLAVEDDQCITTLEALVEKGVQVLVCGTCLDYYGLLDQLKVGTVGNMYDITQSFLKAQKMITV